MPGHLEAVEKVGAPLTGQPPPAFQPSNWEKAGSSDFRWSRDLKRRRPAC